MIEQICKAMGGGELLDKETLAKEGAGFRYGYAIYPRDGEAVDLLPGKAMPEVEVKVGTG